MSQGKEKNDSCLCWIRIVFKNTLDFFSKKKSRVIVRNKVAHIVELTLKIKKGVWKKHPPIEEHAQLILNTCEVLKPERIDVGSREIVCAAALYVGRCLKENISPETYRRAQHVFDRFKKYNGKEMTFEELSTKFSKWFAH